MRRLFSMVLGLTVLAACGDISEPVHAPSVQQALTNPPELLQLESTASRQEIFKDMARTSMGQAGVPTSGLVMFPLIQDGELTAAPGIDPRADLLQGVDGGEPTALSFEVKSADRWPEDRQDGLQGLSEREAAELVARSLMSAWHVKPHAGVQVERAVGAPYAVAYVDGVLRINPAFLYLAAAASGN